MLHHKSLNPFKEDKANQLETISLLLLVIISINGVHDATYVDSGFVPSGVTESISNFIHLIIAIILSVIPVTIIFFNCIWNFINYCETFLDFHLPRI